MGLFKYIVGAAAALTMSAAVAPAFANFPDKPISVVVGFRAGGGSDTSARILAKEMERILGQKVIV